MYEDIYYARLFSWEYCKESLTLLISSTFQIGLPEDLDLPMQRPDFRIAAVTLGASRDIGAQLFCALLRSAGVDARLVCSLQPLPFTATGKVSLSSLPKPPMIMAYPESRNITSCDESETEAQTDRSRPSEKVIGSTGGRTRFASPQIAQTSPINKIASPGPKLPAKPSQHSLVCKRD